MIDLDEDPVQSFAIMRDRQVEAFKKGVAELATTKDELYRAAAKLLLRDVQRIEDEYKHLLPVPEIKVLKKKKELDYG